MDALIGLSDALGEAKVLEDDPLPEYEDSHFEESCAGLAYVEARLLSEQERREMSRAAALLYGSGILIVLFAVLMFPFLCALALTFEPRFVESRYAIGLMMLVTVAAALPIALGSGWMRKARRLRRIRRARQVRRFEGRLNLIDPTDPTLRALAKAGLLEGIDPKTEVSMELLLETDEVYRFNGVRVRRRIPVYITRAVPQPGNMVVLDAPASWFEDPLTVPIERRRLSYPEIEELVGYSTLGRSVWKGVIVQFLCSAWLVGLILKIGHFDRRFRPVVALSLGSLMVGGVVYRLVKRLRLFRMDAGVGWVLIPPSLEGKDSPVVEFLAISRRIWTINGKPAGWRKAKKVEGDGQS